MLTASQLIAKACRLSPSGELKAEHHSRCGVCAANIQVGESVSANTMSKTFTNARDMADYNAPYKCGACVSVLGDQIFQKALSANVFTEEAVYPANKKIHRGYWLLNPPKPPYVFALGVTRSQHVVWRAPVNMSDELMLIQHGDDVLRLRRAPMLDALRAAEKLREIHLEKQVEKGKKQTIPTHRIIPFTYSDMKGQRVFQSEPQRWLVVLLEENPSLRELAAPLFRLTAQESWALDFLFTEGMEKPDPIDVNALFTK